MSIKTPYFEDLYKENCKKSISLCTEVEMLRKLTKRCIAIEALEQYDYLLKQISIKQAQLSVIWDEQIKLNKIIQDGQTEKE